MKRGGGRNARHAAAATAAPPETPMKRGSAGGLRKTAWKLQPEIARPPPMPIAATRRGRRRLNNTLCCAGLSVGRSENDSGNGPARIAHSDRPAKVASSRQVQTKAAMRSEERRGGKECVSKCRSRWSTYH